MTTPNKSTESMSADELAAELYRRQGFLVSNCGRCYMPGEIMQGRDENGLNTPLRVVGPSSYEEFAAQRNLARELGAMPTAGEYRNYYRVEAAD